MITIARKAYFSSASNENSPSPYGHGHNYTLEVFLTGRTDAKTGLLVNLTDVDRVLKKVTGDLDHRHLSLDHPEFKTQSTSLANIARYCFTQFQKEADQLLPARLDKLRLYEGHQSWVDIAGPAK